MDLKFHIIFIPHSVRYLQFGVLSLLRYCDYQFALVCNGLGDGEYQILRRLADRHERLSLMGEPNGRLVPHGQMLNQLLEQAEGDWFCFMDNDIFAAGPFQEQLEARLAECDVFSSGCPICMTADQAVSGYMGMCLKTPGGLPLAVTFIAAYRRQMLQDLISETKIGFESYNPQESLPDIARPPEFKEDLSRSHKLDTGILMNMLAGQKRQWRFDFHDFPQLIHVGGLAAYTQRHRKWSKRVRAFLRGEGRKQVYVLSEENLEPEISKRLKRRHRKHGDANFASIEDERGYLTTKIMRNRVATYFSRLLRALLDGDVMPQIDLPAGHLRDRIAKTAKVLQEVIEEADQK